MVNKQVQLSIDGYIYISGIRKYRRAMVNKQVHVTIGGYRWVYIYQAYISIGEQW